MDKSQFERYAEVKGQIAILEMEIDALAPQLLSQMDEAAVGNVELPGTGTFRRVNRRTWSYPESVASLEAQWKQAKKDAEATGAATATESAILQFVKLKDL